MYIQDDTKIEGTTSRVCSVRENTNKSYLACGLPAELYIAY